MKQKTIMNRIRSTAQKVAAKRLKKAQLKKRESAKKTKSTLSGMAMNYTSDGRISYRESYKGKGLIMEAPMKRGKTVVRKMEVDGIVKKIQCLRVAGTDYITHPDGWRNIEKFSARIGAKLIFS
jgi:hypothetical protein